MSFEQEQNEKLPEAAVNAQAAPKLYYQNLNFEWALQFIRQGEYRVRRSSWADLSKHIVISRIPKLLSLNEEETLLYRLECVCHNSWDFWDISKDDFLAPDAWKPEEKWVCLYAEQRADALGEDPHLRVFDKGQPDVVFIASPADTYGEDWNADYFKAYRLQGLSFVYNKERSVP